MPRFAKKLVKEYGEQTHRDALRAQCSHVDAAWSSVYVAQGCGQIGPRQGDTFHAAIVEYADTTEFPPGFF